MCLEEWTQLNIVCKEKHNFNTVERQIPFIQNACGQKSVRTNIFLMIKRHDYEKACNQSAIFNYLKEITSYWFAGWTQSVWSAETVSGLHKCYNKSQFSKF